MGLGFSICHYGCCSCTSRSLFKNLEDELRLRKKLFSLYGPNSSMITGAQKNLEMDQPIECRWADPKENIK